MFKYVKVMSKVLSVPFFSDTHGPENSILQLRHNYVIIT